MFPLEVNVEISIHGQEVEHGNIMSMKGHLYFIGIVGHAMRGLAVATQDMGYEVTGLDEAAELDAGTQWLEARGIKWYRKADPSQLDGVDRVVISGGTAADDPTIAEAKRRGLPVTSFAELVGELTADERVIAVAGTHGKTTTTSLITWLLESAGRHPDFLVGIRPFNFDSSVRLASSQVAVIEGDEYKASSFENRSKVQYYHPDVLVLTSAEHDHPDVFPDKASVIARFEAVVSAIPEAGRLVAWAESDDVVKIAESATCQITTYGLADGDYTARDIAYLPGGIEFDIENGSGILGRIAVPLYGKHNVLNALAAVAVAIGEGLTVEEIIHGAASFRGAYRRFNVLTEPAADVAVIDDYAHHPTEVATTVGAAKLHFDGRRIIAVFRPHTYSRTAALLDEYHHSFGSADLVYVTDIEGAREAGTQHTVSGADIVKGLSTSAIYIEGRQELSDRIKRDSRPGDVVLCMTVSGYDQLAEELATKLNS